MSQAVKVTAPIVSLLCCNLFESGLVISFFVDQASDQRKKQFDTKELLRLTDAILLTVHN